MLAISDLIQQPATLWTIVAVLSTWAVASGCFALKGIWRTKRAIRMARARISRLPDPSAFTGEYEEVSADLATLDLIGPRWRVFRETLLIDGAGRRPVRATISAENWFNTSLLQDANLDLRYHAALPSLLVGAGLLFTFLGLTFALRKAGAVVADNVSLSDRNHALQQLLDLASFKFVTSVAGLALSIGYALFWKQACMRAVDREIAGLVQDLHKRIPLYTELAAQEEANTVAERQLAQLETFSTDLAVAIGEKLDSAFDQRLGEHIAPLREALERLASRTSEDNTAALQRMLDVFLERLQGGAGSRMEGVAERLETLGESLKGLETGLRDVAGHMADGAGAMAQRLGEGAEAALTRITDQMNGLAQTLSEVALQTRTAGADAGSEMATRIKDAASQFEGAIVKLVTEADTLAARIGELQQAAGETTPALLASAGDLRAASETALASVQPLREVAQTVTTAVQQIGGAAERLQAAEHGAEATALALTAAAQKFDGLDRELGKVLEQLSRGLQGFTKEVEKVVVGTDQNLAKAATQLGSAIRQLEEALEDHHPAAAKVVRA